MKKKKPVDPELKIILTELEEVVMRLGFKVRYEKGDFEGGYCMLMDSHLIVINSRNEIEKRIANLCRSAKQIGINDIFIKPNIREIIENESSKPKVKKAPAEPDLFAQEQAEQNKQPEETQKEPREEAKEENQHK
jgi:hypothetical protein